MLPIKNEKVKARRITGFPQHCFFGYYDVPAFSQDGKYHLCHRVSFWDRIPEAGETAQIGMIELATKEFIPLAETEAWNFQQGSMLQWHPCFPNEKVIYNAMGKEGPHGVVLDIRTGNKTMLERPIANVDPTGRYALSISFERMFDFRPGYGYAGVPDKFLECNAPKEDGIFLVDLEKGKAKLILSLADIYEITQQTLPFPDAKLLINHITFNTDGSRFVFLARTFPKEGGTWKTVTVTANRDGSQPYVLRGYDMASHYHWRDQTSLLIYANGSQGPQLYVLKDKSRDCEVLDKEFFVQDGHCSYSPDRKWLLYDSAPDKESYRHLYLYNLAQRKGVRLASYYAYPHITGDFRCDLHPRWSSRGDMISFDSIHEGQRHIYSIHLEECLGLF